MELDIKSIMGGLGLGLGLGFRLDKRSMLGMAVVVLLVAANICNGNEYDEAKGKAAEAGKESTESWTGWAKDKLSEGLGLRTHGITYYTSIFIH